MKSRVVDNQELFNEAETLNNAGKLEKASAIYLELESDPLYGPFCDYRLAQIANKMNDPTTAYDLYYKAFNRKNNLCSAIFPENHPGHKYVFGGMKEELEYDNCPLCGKEGKPYWCYPLPEAAGYHAQFNPIRLWLHCDVCNHVLSKYYPERLFIYNNSPRNANPAFFSMYSGVLSRISQYTKGRSILEVGIGACECALAAREIGYDVFGLDVIERHVVDAREKYGLNAETHDFNEFETDSTFDIIMMGDVLEHVTDPVIAIKKAHSLLNDSGALWVSTPNFESAFSTVAAHDDAMRRQTYHLNYFSRDSFYKLLELCGFRPVDYQISSHYNGSMEVIAVKV